MDDFWSEPTYTHRLPILTRWQRFVTWLMNLRFRRCRRAGYGCGWWWAYGFVPEAGCPFHD